MFRIRRVYNEILPVNVEALRQVREILRSHFDDVKEEEILGLGESLQNPFKEQFRIVLLVAENIGRQRALGFAVLSHDPRLKFCFLDYLAIAEKRKGGGIGGALYQHVRENAIALGAEALLFECPPDDPKIIKNKEKLRENRARLRFYERYGARPIINTKYETPTKPDDIIAPHLLYDPLDADKPLRRNLARKAVRAILERKYPDNCTPEYIKMVVDSFRDDPVKIRDFKYVKPETVEPPRAVDGTQPIALVVTDRHAIHHVRERGYVEAPVRIQSILTDLTATGLFERVNPRHFPDKHLYESHDRALVNFIKKASGLAPEGRSLYPYIFPVRNRVRVPDEPSVIAGYYCIDTFTPINRNAYPAARRAVDCALTAARELARGRRISYALVRPPGHHAEKDVFGGFCYFNNTAIAAQYLSVYGSVAILDIDYHHGNGQQEIFYGRADVLTVSIHGHPRFAYPYFTGFADEKGVGVGEGFNVNIPLAKQLDGESYRRALKRAIARVEDFAPDFLVVALGLDTAKADPTGTWQLQAKDFETNGAMIAGLNLPTLIIQEGGYRTRTLGRNARSFFEGIVRGMPGEPKRRPRSAMKQKTRKADTVAAPDSYFRYEAKSADRAAVRRLVEAAAVFSADEVDLAVELVDERLRKGDASGYYFVFLESGGETAGYACYGPIACTRSSFDLYWIAVAPEYQGRGFARALIEEVKKQVVEAGGDRLYAETSGRSQYQPARTFYEKCGFRKVSELKDFYGPGDPKVTYATDIGGT